MDARVDESTLQLTDTFDDIFDTDVGNKMLDVNVAVMSDDASNAYTASFADTFNDATPGMQAIRETVDYKNALAQSDLRPAGQIGTVERADDIYKYMEDARTDAMTAPDAVGRRNDTHTSNKIKTTLEDYRGELTSQSANYKNAINTFAGKAQLEDTFDRGSKLVFGSRRNFDKELSRLTTDSEKDAFKAGVLTEIKNKMEKKSLQGKASANMFDNIAIQGNLEKVFGVKKTKSIIRAAKERANAIRVGNKFKEPKTVTNATNRLAERALSGGRGVNRAASQVAVEGIPMTKKQRRQLADYMTQPANTAPQLSRDLEKMLRDKSAQQTLIQSLGVNTGLTGFHQQ